MTNSAHIANVTAADFEAVVLQGSFERPVLVDFWADWCAPCRQLMPILSRLAEEFNGQFMLAKVDTEAEQALAAQFGIRSLPTVQLFKDGQPVDQFMGALPEAQIREFLARHVNRASDLLLAQAREAMLDGDLSSATALIEQAEQEDPENKRVFVAQVQLKAAEGNAEGALALLERTPLELTDDTDLAALRGRLAFGAAVANAPPPDQLEAKLNADPNDSAARYQLASHQVLSGNNEAALENLLTLLRQDRQYGEDAARKGMISIFDLLGGDDPLVRTYRAKMLSSLY
jgi:putative thioredoxin